MCEDVRRRKKASKPDKASENQSRDCRWSTREPPKTLFSAGWILPHFAADNCLLLLFKTLSHFPAVFQTFHLLVKCALGSPGHDLRPRRNLVTGRKVSGGHQDGFPSSRFLRISHKKWDFCMARDNTASSVWNISSDLS